VLSLQPVTGQNRIGQNGNGQNGNGQNGTHKMLAIFIDFN